MRFDGAQEIFSRAAALAAALAMACMLGACAEVKQKVGGIGDGAGKSRDPVPALPTQPPPAAPAVQAAPPAPSTIIARAKAAVAHPARELNLRSECRSRDQTGYTESIKLAVNQGRVDLMEATIDIPRRGSCGFHLAEFRQTRTEPHVELKASTGSKCTVRMWQQGSRFTVAFSDCQEKCTRGAFDYVWPVELNSGDGSCM